jgi:hypothetical protein
MLGVIAQSNVRDVKYCHKGPYLVLLEPGGSIQALSMLYNMLSLIASYGKEFPIDTRRKWPFLVLLMGLHDAHSVRRVSIYVV